MPIPYTLYNPNFTAEGRSADNMLLAALAMNAKMALVRDSPKLVSMCKVVGMSTIFRFVPTDGNFSMSPQDFVDQRINQSPDCDFVHLTNECGLPDGLGQWTERAALYAEAHGKRVVAFNVETNHDLARYKLLLPTFKWLTERGHAVGVHIYLDGTHDAGGYAPLDWLKQNGIRVFVTEYGYIRSIFDANTGWRAVMGSAELNSWNDAHSARMAKYSFPLFHFSTDHWPNNEYGRVMGFGTEDRPEIQLHFGVLNFQYPIKETLVVAPIPLPVPEPTLGGVHGTLTKIPASYVNLRAYPNGPDIGDMRKGETCTYFPNFIQSGFIFVRPDKGGKGWVSLQNGAVEFTADGAVTSGLLKPPVSCAVVLTSPFGVPRDYDGDGIKDDIHEGVDYAPKHADCTPAILCALAGTVEKVSSIGPYGNHVTVRSTVGIQTYVIWYAHMKVMFVSPGQVLKVGDVIGLMGSTGNSTGVHLHFTVQKLGATTPAGSPVANVVDPHVLIDWV